MKTNSIPLEIFGDTLDEAVKKGLEQLGATRDEVTVEVVDEGNRGVFGIGARPVHIRISRKEQVTLSDSSETEPPPPPQVPIPEEHPQTVEVDNAVEEKVEPVQAPQSSDDQELDDEENENLKISRSAVSELLEHMNITADVDAYYGEADDRSNQKPIHVEIHGRDLSILIGRKAETLNSLQFITKLIVGKEFGHAVPIIVDVEGYRGRRENEIRQVARRMADQVISTGRSMPLEPMPANERRIVHLELRKNPSVITESTGEGPRRKVIIKPQK